jgi:phosphohistidine phosphatase SixA
MHITGSKLERIRTFLTRSATTTTLLATACFCLVGPGYAAPLTGNNLVSALRSGGYVILMRHASSPRSPPAPADANPDNVGHERQLDEEGRASAKAMGAALHSLRIPLGTVISSPTYRALETARLAQLGSPKTEPELGDAGHSMQADPSGQRGAWLKKRVATAPPHGVNTIIITHLPNISEALPELAKGLEDGEALILQPDHHGGTTFVGRVKIGEWSQLTTHS